MIVLRLALQSLRNSWLTALMTVFAIAVSIALLLGAEKVRTGARQSFTDTISGVDLVVGARSGTLNLLLYSVFRIGNATNNITWSSYSELAARPEVAWSVPLSLGDTDRGFRVLGTTPDYFEHYHYRHGLGLTFSAGKPFADLFDAVVGADVASALGYQLGDRIVIAHGLGSVSFLAHEDKPFRVAGILAKTGTAVDRTVHVSLSAIEAIHIDWQSGAPAPGQSLSAEDVRRGIVLLYASLLLLQPYVDRAYGLFLPLTLPRLDEWTMLGLIVLAGALAGLLPAVRAYRLSLADGMTVRTA